MVRFELMEPRSLSEACSLLAEHKEEAKVIAGGQSLLILLKHRLIALRYIINIKGLPELDYISNGENGLRIGALTTHRAIETSAVIQGRYLALAEAEKQVACVQVRNWGTIGGNLCHADPGGNPAPALIALGSKVRTISVRGEREIALEDFFIDYLETVLEPDEILVEIQLPSPLPYTGGAYYKESVRVGDMPIAAVAAVVSLNSEQNIVTDARIVMGSVGKTPVRAREAEKLVIGAKADNRLIEQVAAAAAKEAQPTSDIHGSVEYKREIVKVIARQAVGQALKRAQAFSLRGGDR